jgi:hypothetical protein
VLDAVATPPLLANATFSDEGATGATALDALDVALPTVVAIVTVQV